MTSEWVTIANLAELSEGELVAVSEAGCDLVVIRRGEGVRVLSGRCPHRAARLAEHGRVDGPVVVCQRHGWDFRIDDGAPAQGIGEGLTVFASRIDPALGTVQVERASLLTHASSPTAFRLDEDVS